MPSTAENLPEKSTKHDVVEIHPSDSIVFSETLKREQLGSMSSLNESTGQLQTAMNQMVNKHKGNEARVLTPDELHSISELGATIALTIRVKNEAMKLARKLNRA